MNIWEISICEYWARPQTEHEHCLRKALQYQRCRGNFKLENFSVRQKVDFLFIFAGFQTSSSIIILPQHWKCSCLKHSWAIFYFKVPVKPKENTLDRVVWIHHSSHRNKFQARIMRFDCKEFYVAQQYKELRVRSYLNGQFWIGFSCFVWISLIFSFRSYLRTSQVNDKSVFSSNFEFFHHVAESANILIYFWYWLRVIELVFSWRCNSVNPSAC